MIRKLRRKFVIILMCVVSFILLGIFAYMLMSFRSNNQHMSENMLRQTLNLSPNMSEVRAPPNRGESSMPPNPPELGRPPNMGVRDSAGSAFPGQRMSVLLATIDADGDVFLLTHQLHFMDEDEAKSVVLEAMNTNQSKGVMRDRELRWQKSEDGIRIAFVDISMEQDMLNNLIRNFVLIGIASLTVFHLFSLFLARWAVRPIELAWERQRQFVADASHELKTPLTVILSNAEILGGNKATTNEKNRRRIEHIRGEAVLMKNLIEDLLTLAKSDSIEHTKIEERVAFSFIVTSAVLTFEPMVFDAKKVLTYDVRDNIFVTGNSGRLNQLVGILLDNAVKYCPPKGKIHIRLSEPDKKTALLTVTNDGEAIPKEELSKIFERFYQIDKSRSAPGSFGLGLSIAQGIVAEHGGKIWAESGEDAGNSFHVSLPVRRKPTALNVKKPQAREIPPAAF